MAPGPCCIRQLDITVSLCTSGWALPCGIIRPAPIRCAVQCHKSIYWLQYSEQDRISNGHLDAHLITPSDSSEDRAKRHNLRPIRCWVNLTHGNTYVHEPFNFSTVRGQKTRDSIDQSYWDVLAAKPSMFSNPVPRCDLPTYSIHVDRDIHTIFPRMMAVAQDMQNPPLP
jgi:hypothetical protein